MGFIVSNLFFFKPAYCKINAEPVCNKKITMAEKKQESGLTPLIEVKYLDLDSTPNYHLLPIGSPLPLLNRYYTAATSDNTRRAYQSDIRHFENWGGKLPATSETVLRYLHAFAKTLNPRTLARRLTAVSQWHKLQRFKDPTDDPLVTKTLAGILRVHGRPKNKAAPLSPEQLIKIVDYLSKQNTLAASRDSALLQLGFLGALRRSELVNIQVEHIAWQPEGIEILIPSSKTDQTHEGQYCAVPNGNGRLCAVRALKAWLENANITDGLIFRRLHRSNKLSSSPLAAAFINQILKNRAYAAGIENANELSGHSLRRGLASTASFNGASISAIMRQGRWKQVNTVMEYIEAAQRFEENAAGKVLEKFRQ